MNAFQAAWTISSLLILPFILRSWPSLGCYLLLVAAQTVVLASVAGTHAYFWAYYGFGTGLDACEFWLVAQIAIAAAGVTPKIRSAIRKWTLNLSLFLVGFFGTLAIAETRSAAYRIASLASHLDMAVSLSSLVCLSCVLAVCGHFNINISRRVRLITAGLFFDQLASVASLLVTNVTCVSSLRFTGYVTGLVFWSASIDFPSMSVYMQGFPWICGSSGKRSLGQ